MHSLQESGLPPTPQEYYDRIAPDYEAKLSNLFFKIYDIITWQSIQSCLPEQKTARILDLAGGTGRWSRKMALRDYELVLVDLSRNMLREAKRMARMEKLSDRICFVRADARSLPFVDNQFDLVLCEHSLHVIDRPESLVSETLRILKSGAVTIITTTGKYHKAILSLRQNSEEALAILRGATSEFYRNWLSPDEFLSMIRAEGFLIDRVVGKGFLDLAVPEGILFSEKYTEANYIDNLRVEEELSSRRDAIGLASHIQVVARKP